MGKLLQAGFALFIAYWVVAPQQLAAHFDTPGYRAAKAEMSASHPADKLAADIKTWLNAKADAY